MTRKGVWNLQQVRDKYLQSLWANTGQLFSWGDGAQGQLGVNSRAHYSSPVQVSGDWDGSTVFNTGESTMNGVTAIKSDGTLWTWGYNERGQLGLNDTARRSSPTQVPGTTWAHSTEGRHILRTKTDGTLWASGYQENYGQLGQNSRIDYSSPVQIPGTNWGTTKFKISTGEYSSQALKTDGTLWVWGFNENGILGLNQSTPAAVSSPTQLPGTTWSHLSGARGSYVTVIKTDGTLWAWGRNNYGQLAQNNDNDGRSSPVQVPGTTWKYIQSGNKSSLAIKTDGTLWSWGYNLNGALGLNDRTDRSSPAQVGSDTTWDVGVTSGGEYTSIARKTDGTLWAWGNNSKGQLGQNSITKYSSPVQIPGSWTDEIGVTDESILAIKNTLTPSQL